MKQKSAPKPRNPFVQHLVKKKQGVHAKPYKNERKAIKISLRKEDYSKTKVA